ncbi:MAG: DUF4288 domain-containing protein [FCB group bacterium]|jgi:hypothetical protein|nr:DUF4288 domain-containing protein [FCB group bacterium]
MASPWKWFSAKTIYRLDVEGEPLATDRNYEPNATLIEERVVLIRARNHDEAIRIAEKEADDYPGEPYLNPYGQKVSYRPFGRTETYELFDPPANRAEVWSSTSLLPGSISDDEIIEDRFGPIEKSIKKRKKFMDQEFSGIVRPRRQRVRGSD